VGRERSHLGESRVHPEIQKDKGVEDQNIELLSDEWLAQMHSTTKHWDNIVDEPRDKVEEEWEYFHRFGRS
jgi:hypothetical protein